MSYSLGAMVWFFFINILRDKMTAKKPLPKYIRSIVTHIICYLACKKPYKYETVKENKTTFLLSNENTPCNKNFIFFYIRTQVLRFSNVF